MVSRRRRCGLIRFARALAEQFHPDKIILFGSYAYGTPHTDSDVDILVTVPCRKRTRHGGAKDRSYC